MSLLPKEHGTYGQITLPLATALGAAGVSSAGLLVAATVVAGFLAHEPAVLLLGVRGPRAKRELQRRATRWLLTCLVAAIGAGVAALLTIAPGARWSIAVPLVPALLLAIESFRGHEKSWYGEVTASLAFAGAAFPVSLAAGVPWQTAATIVIPFALLFVIGTLAVRVVILRVRAGGDPRATTLTRRTALLLAAIAAATLAGINAAGLLPASVLVASAPGLLAAVVIAARPPAPTRLRTLGQGRRAFRLRAYESAAVQGGPEGQAVAHPARELPWSGTRFAPGSFALLPNDDQPRELRIVCTNFECDFTRDRPLPIVAVDEPIYRRLPAFLILTVDKLASLPWVGAAGMLLGGADRYDGTGFYGSAEPGTGTRLSTPLPPPDLVIQDELHLIAGPLGTMAGLYEAAIEALCARHVDGRAVRPKIVASTATVRRAQEQIQSLFARSLTQVFPPPGPEARRSPDVLRRTVRFDAVR